MQTTLNYPINCKFAFFKAGLQGLSLRYKIQRTVKEVIQTPYYSPEKEQNTGVNSLSVRRSSTSLLRRIAMKKYLLAGLRYSFAAALLFPASGLKAQSGYNMLEGKNVQARFSADGILSWDGRNAHFEAPLGSGRNTISSAALWIGGLDKNHALHMSAQTYRETGSDFWPGPLDNNGAITPNVSAAYDKVWKITKLEVDSFRAGLGTPDAVLNWPAQAPFVDVDHNNKYEPLKGDYPDIKGDEMVWWVMNDNLDMHTGTGGLPMGVEIQCSAWTFKCDDPALRSSVFLSYHIINRSAEQYDSVYAGLWSDFDIGNLFDDYVGSSPALNAFFGYNGDGFDNDTTITSKSGNYFYKGYGRQLPAQGISFLQGIKGDNGSEMPMSKFIYYNNSITIQGNPAVPAQYYNYLRGIWPDNTTMTYGGTGIRGTQNTDYAFPGMPGDPNGWSEESAANTPGDRRGLGSFGPFTLKPGDEKDLTAVFVFAQAANGKSDESVNEMLSSVKSIQRLYKQNALQGCTGISTCMSDSCVWPGDANRDGVARMNDIFNIGYAYGSTGPARPLASSAWISQQGQNWGQTFPDGTDFHYADANGDGRIDSLDVLPIVLNDRNVAHKTEASASGTNPLLKLHIIEDSVKAGDVVHGEIILGSQDFPADDVYGVALTINYDSTLVVPGTFQFDLTGGNLGNPGEIVIATADHKGYTDIGITRNDKKGKNTTDIILRWKYVIVGDVAGVTQPPAQFKMSNVDTRDPNLKIINTDTANDMVIVVAHPTAIYSPEALDAIIRMYPNPASEHLAISSGNLTMSSLKILNAQGQLISAYTSKGSSTILDVHSLPAGVYFIQVQTSQGSTVKKFMKLR
jgi:hypothetical protein